MVRKKTTNLPVADQVHKEYTVTEFYAQKKTATKKQH